MTNRNIKNKSMPITKPNKRHVMPETTTLPKSHLVISYTLKKPTHWVSFLHGIKLDSWFVDLLGVSKIKNPEMATMPNKDAPITSDLVISFPKSSYIEPRNRAFPPLSPLSYAHPSMVDMINQGILNL